jgi:MFS family permease
VKPRFNILVRNMLIASGSYAAKVKRFSFNARMYLLFVFLTTLNAGIYGVIFNLYILRLGFGEDFLGLILSSSSTAMGLFAIPAAFVCDRLGRKRTLLLSSLLSVFSLLFLYNITSPSLLVLFSVAMGMAGSLSLITGSTFLLENSAREERMYLFSMSSLIYTFSILSGNMIGGSFPGVMAGIFSLEIGGAEAYRLTLYLSLIATTASLLPLIFVTEAKALNGDGIGSQLGIYISIFKSKAVRQMTFFYCLYGIGWGTSLPYFNVYFATVLGADANQIGIFFSISQLFMIFGYFMVPILAERTGRVKLVASVQILSIPFLLLFVHTNNLLLAVIGFVMRYMLMNMANPILNSFKLEIVKPEERSIINSVMWMACYTFVGIGTYAGGMMMAEGYSSMPFLITALLYGVTAVLYYIYFNKLEKSMAL